MNKKSCAMNFIWFYYDYISLFYSIYFIINKILPFSWKKVIYLVIIMVMYPRSCITSSLSVFNHKVLVEMAEGQLFIWTIIKLKQFNTSSTVCGWLFTAGYYTFQPAYIIFLQCLHIILLLSYVYIPKLLF